jgi:hypothetical protein
MKHLFLRSIAVLCFLPGFAWAQAKLENPEPGSIQSGIGVISGWVCDTSRVDIVIDGVSFQAGYGTSREDTRPVCGDADNGFGLLFNWNLAKDGTHTVQALAGGVEFAQVTVNVVTLGAEFLTGLAASSIAPDFPSPGLSTTTQWQQSLQNFVISRVEVTTATGRVSDAPSVFGVIANNGFRYGSDLFGAGAGVLTLGSLTASASSAVNAAAATDSVLTGSFVMMRDDGTIAAGQVDSEDRDEDGLADCNFTFTMSQFPKDEGPQVGTVIPCALCDFRINSAGVAPGSEGLGWLEWDLDLVRNPTTIQNPLLTSNSLPVQIGRDASGNIVTVNGIPVVTSR